MAYPIWIGVDREGRALVGAAEVNAARDRGRLHDLDQVYPSQLRYRVTAFYPESGSHVTGIAPAAPGKRRRTLPGRWKIRTRSQVHADVRACRNVLFNFAESSHVFPKADHARARRKVTP